MNRKSLRITRAFFRISQNRYAEKGYIADFRVTGIMPNARKDKPKTLFFSPYAGHIHAQPLFGHSGDACIRPSDWRALVKRAPVDPDPLDKTPVTITPEIETQARASMLSWADSAERQLAEAHPNYAQSLEARFNPVQFGEETI